MMGALYIYDRRISGIPVVAAAFSINQLARMPFARMVSCGKKQVKRINLLGLEMHSSKQKYGQSNEGLAWGTIFFVGHF